MLAVVAEEDHPVGDDRVAHRTMDRLFRRPMDDCVLQNRANDRRSLEIAVEAPAIIDLMARLARGTAEDPVLS